MYIRLHVKCPLFLWDFNETGIFLADFEKYSNIKFHKNIRPVEAKFFHADGWTDRRYTDIRRLVFAVLRLSLKNSEIYIFCLLFYSFFLRLFLPSPSPPLITRTGLNRVTKLTAIGGSQSCFPAVYFHVLPSNFKFLCVFFICRTVIWKRSRHVEYTGYQKCLRDFGWEISMEEITGGYACGYNWIMRILLKHILRIYGVVLRTRFNLLGMMLSGWVLWIRLFTFFF